MAEQKKEHGAAKKEGPPRITGLEMLAGATLPVRLNLRVRLHSGMDQRVEASLAPATARALNAVRAQDEKLMRWLNADRSRPAQFIADPLAALKAARIEIGDADWSVLERLQRARLNTDLLPPGVELQTVAVEVGKKRSFAERRESRRRERDEKGKGEKPRKPTKEAL